MTDADFDTLSWHDCHVWGLALRPGDPDTGDWRSDLILDIDYILEWLCGVDGVTRFRVAPADLAFHGVTDLEIHLDWDAGGQVALHPLSIHGIERAIVSNQKVYLDRPYYRWTVGLNWPQGAAIRFGAVGFTLTLRDEPVVTESQSLSRPG
jgi:hypothetical protein